MRGLILENLRNLIAKVEAGVFEGIEERIESCWKELWEKKTDPHFPQKTLQENQKLLTEITVAIEAFLSGHIDKDKIHTILKRVHGESKK
ncbi:MAG: hypothetical protein ACETWM_20060 [Candidatus Lokiarchaeia archaeon]